MSVSTRRRWRGAGQAARREGGRREASQDRQDAVRFSSILVIDVMTGRNDCPSEREVLD